MASLTEAISQSIIGSLDPNVAATRDFVASAVKEKQLQTDMLRVQGIESITASLIKAIAENAPASAIAGLEKILARVAAGA